MDSQGHKGEKGMVGDPGQQGDDGSVVSAVNDLRITLCPNDPRHLYYRCDCQVEQKTLLLYAC